MPAAYAIKDQEERIRKGLECKKNLVAMGFDPAIKWKLVKEEGPTKVYRADEPFQNSGQRPCKSVLVVNKSAEAVDRLCNAFNRYRIQWDKIFEGVEVIEKLSEEAYFACHQTRKSLKGVFAARESIDVYTAGGMEALPDGSMAYCHCLVTMEEDFKNYPPTQGRVRVKNFCNGFLVCPMENEPDKCTLITVLCSDLNMNAIGAMMTEWVKPALMVQICQDLVNYIEKNPSEPRDL